MLGQFRRLTTIREQPRSPFSVIRDLSDQRVEVEFGVNERIDPVDFLDRLGPMAPVRPDRGDRQEKGSWIPCEVALLRIPPLLLLYQPGGM